MAVDMKYQERIDTTTIYGSLLMEEVFYITNNYYGDMWDGKVKSGRS